MENVNWIQLMQSFGLATFILLAVGYACWRTCQWLGKEILIPFRERVITRFDIFLTRIENTAKKAAKAAYAARATLISTVVEVRERHDTLLNEVKETKALAKDILEKVKPPL